MKTGWGIKLGEIEMFLWEIFGSIWNYCKRETKLPSTEIGWEMKLGEKGMIVWEILGSAYNYFKKEKKLPSEGRKLERTLFWELMKLSAMISKANVIKKKKSNESVSMEGKK